MDAAEWQRVRQLFEEALEKGSAHRGPFLDEACDDERIRAEVQALLDCDADAPDAFMRPTADEVVAEPSLMFGESVGGHQILRVIASGGMGTVYEAEQASPRRKVAVKVMHSLAWSRSARGRFEFESQVLAHLTHPSIAQVYSTGTHGDLPYFVMELVSDALSITRYATKRNLPTKRRIELFLQCCDAVQHGHQKGIIHRDLKPGNILVNSQRHVKIIDFGVARSTDSDIAATTIRTDIGQIVGTLQYMSPEQCDAAPFGIDVRSDVYALGVVLFELLCDELPYNVGRRSLASAARVICEQETTRPSDLHRSLRGDLELILLKALEKDRDRRYQSVADLARDLRHFLAREPIEAKPPTAWTRAMNSVRRHPLVATTSASILVALLIVGSSLLAVRFAQWRPWELMPSSDHRELRLLALSGDTLHTWTTDPENLIIHGVLVDARVSKRMTKLAVIGRSRDDKKPGRSEVCAYDVGVGAYETALWCDGVRTADLPDDPTRVLQAEGFGVAMTFAANVFEDCEGDEIIAVYAHEYSRTALRVYSVTGKRLFQVWHDGAIGSLTHLSRAGRLIVASYHDTHPLESRGFAPNEGVQRMGKPYVIWAITLAKQWHTRYVCTDGPAAGCVAPDWYKCLLPIERLSGIDIVTLLPASGAFDDGSHVRLDLTYTSPQDEPRAHAAWTIDEAGKQAGTEFHKTDSYTVHEEELVPIEEFKLGPLPPVVEWKRRPTGADSTRE